MNKGKPLINNQAGSSRMDTVLKMLLIAFIALLAFSSGVFFGKQLSDTDYQLRALESDFTNGHGAKTADNGHESPEDAINQDEVAALSEKLVNGEKADLEHGDQNEESRKIASNEDAHHDAAPAHEAAAPAHGAAPAPAGHATATAAHGAEAAAHGAPAAANGAAAHGAAATAPKAHAPAAHDQPAKEPAKAPAPAHSASATQKPDLTAATKAAIRVANNAAPTEAPKAGGENRVPTSLPKTVGTSQDVEFTVQVASYPTAQIAKEHADELIKKGFPAFPVEATVNGKVWYRVSVGSFKSQREATVYRAQLLKQTSLPSAIVQKITR